MSKYTTQTDTLQQDTENNLNSSVYDGSSLHKYRTEIPNIIFDIGLSAHEMILYIELKRIASDTGKCWYSVPNLAKKLGVSERTIQYCKKSLSKTNPKLENRSLIRIEKRKKSNSRENLPDIITIVDIWDLNFKIFYTGALYAPYGAKNDIKDKIGGAQDAPYGAPNAPKEEPLEEEPKKESLCPKSKISDEAKDLSNIFLKNITEEKPDFKVPRNLYSWSECFDKMIRLDGRDVDKIIAVIEWVTHDSFWKANILSPSKLREKFDQLELKMSSPTNPGNDPEKNKSMSEKFAKQNSNRSKEFYVGDSYIEFIYGGQCASDLIYYSDSKFIEKVKAAKMKWGN